MILTKSEATAEVFLTAFQALSKKERGKVIVGITRDKRMRENLIDLAIIQERKKEPARPFREYLQNKNRKHFNRTVCEDICSKFKYPIEK